jgi:TolA-binding protein
MTRLGALGWAVLACAALASSRPAHGEERRPSLGELSTRLAHVRGQLKNAEDNLKFVETQYTLRPEATPSEAHERRFSDGEIQYLLGDYSHAAVLFYDLVSDSTFRENSPRYPDALNYLADALYHQGNLLGARLYLRQLLQIPSNHERAALARYLEVAGNLNEFAGIDPLIEQARRNAGGTLPPELTYVYGKWLFKRSDLKNEDRWARADETFNSLVGKESRYQWQARYFLGVLSVQRGALDEAVERFKAITEYKGEGGPPVEVRELAQLSLGRVLFELGRHDEAVDRYQEVPRESPRFPEALYETAWTYVKRGQYEQARNAADLVLLVAPDSTLAPEAQLLLAHLQLKLKKYREADQTYNGVINTYAPVRDEVDALLTVHQDPVAYFDKLLARRDHDLDVTQLLPAVALKWATTQKEVAEAIQMVGDLELGRQSMKEARDLADRILQALNTRALEAFPAIQEGYTRSTAVSSALTQSEQELVRVEAALTEGYLSPTEHARLDQLRKESRELEQQFARIPHSAEELQSRRTRLRARVDQLDHEAFRLVNEIQSLHAVIAALGKWLTDTRGERNNTPEDEKAFIAKIKGESQELGWLGDEVTRLRAALIQERSQADVTVSGENVIRTDYARLLTAEREILQNATGRLPAEAAALIQETQAIRTQAEGLQARAEAAQNVLTEQLKRRGEQIRNKVMDEQMLLSKYSQEVTGISGDARQLVGRIAFDSFRRVRQQFYDLVLKADVGLVDVAFTRKQDKTTDIQKLSAEKDHALKGLDTEFQSVLEEGD